MASGKKIDWRPGYTDTLFLIFLTLKSTNLIDWPWWQVFIPLYVWLGLVLVGFFYGVGKGVGEREAKNS